MVEIDNQKAGNCKVMETNTVDYYKLPLITVKLPETCEGTSPKILRACSTAQEISDSQNNMFVFAVFAVAVAHGL
jgi:hypothetical protein